jgi:hypothetical protein
VFAHCTDLLPAAHSARAAPFQSLATTAPCNRFVSERHGWIVSTPGDKVIMIETLPGSSLPADLRNAGYKVNPPGQGERILAGSVVQRFTTTSSGALEPMTEGSTKPLSVKVERWAFRLSISLLLP